ncbi:Predicted SAM-depedendent methyltransferase [Variovorax sp. YR216]|nr:Predicted SAM-depedendent methyltransferase [Variovorax sp. YR216]
MDKKTNVETETRIIAHEKVESAKENGIRLNLGCGHVPLDGYLNVDRRALPGVDIVAEVDSLPFESGQVSEISSAHMLEHFPQEELRRKLLPYWFSLLKNGGTFRAIVPDAEGMIEAFRSNEYTFDRLREVTFGGQDYDGDFHYNMMTTESLRTLLEEVGFSEFTVIEKNRENGGCKEFEIVACRRGEVSK